MGVPVDRLATKRAGFTLPAVCAEVAQLVERNLAKVEVAGSSPVFRSRATWPSG